ncbi:MAG: hypothetical protein SFV19_14830, partial [Rhodospirillaceae bacterium]|nr:hypothetical protein [Rhodospirillaceae bacterium]
RHAAHSAALFVWVVFEPDMAPSMSYLRALNEYQTIFGKSEKESTIEEKRFVELMRRYGFSHMDQFDRAIADGVERGYFIPEDVVAHAKDLEARLIHDEHSRSMSCIWAMYYESFDNNEKEVLENLEAVANENRQYLNVGELESVIRILKEHGRTDTARKFLADFMAHSTRARDFFNVDSAGSLRNVVDPDIRKAFKERFASLSVKQEPAEILKRIHANQAWGSEDVAFLSSLTPDDFYRVFKESRGPELHSIVTQALTFGRFADASKEMLGISENAKAALRRIGGENQINAIRIKRFGL